MNKWISNFCSDNDNEHKEALARLKDVFSLTKSKEIKYEMKATCKIKKDKGDERFQCIKQVEYVNKNYPTDLYKFIKVEAYKVKKTNKKSLAVVHVKNSNNDAFKNVLIYCDCHRSNIGLTLPTLIDLSTMLKFDVIGFDYSGNGLSEGEFKEEEMLKDVEEIADFVKNGLLYKPENVIVMGLSLGCIPAIHLLSLKKYNTFKGLVLVSPVSTGILFPKESMPLNEKSHTKHYFYNLVHNISEICCPIMIVHSLVDKVVEVEHTKELARLISYDWSFEWYPASGSHLKVIYQNRKTFFIKLKSFIDNIDIFANRYGDSNSPESSFVKVKMSQNVVFAFESDTRKESNLDQDIYTIRGSSMVKSQHRSSSPKTRNQSPSRKGNKSIMFGGIEVIPCAKDSDKENTTSLFSPFEKASFDKKKGLDDIKPSLFKTSGIKFKPKFSNYDDIHSIDQIEEEYKVIKQEKDIID